MLWRLPFSSTKTTGPTLHCQITGAEWEWTDEIHLKLKLTNKWRTICCQLASPAKQGALYWEGERTILRVALPVKMWGAFTVIFYLTFSEMGIAKIGIFLPMCSLSYFNFLVLERAKLSFGSMSLCRSWVSPENRLRLPQRNHSPFYPYFISLPMTSNL
jgi:hypothetical protein